jgi:dinuclear metal center YbgI/SA1388 family protein
MNGNELIEVLRKHYPEHVSYEWDNTGMQVGMPTDNVHGILLCLDVTKEVIEEATKLKCNWILSHHPLLFQPFKKLDFTSANAKIIRSLIKNDINLYSLHTNFDLAPTGMNYILAQHLSLLNVLPMEPDAKGVTAGVVGSLPTEMPLEELAQQLKQIFDLDDVRFVGDATSLVKKVAIVGGSGTSTMFEAVESSADCLITGDISHHKALDALSLGLKMIDVGHGIEFVGFRQIKDVLQKEGISVPIYLSESNTFPIKSK